MTCTKCNAGSLYRQKSRPRRLICVACRDEVSIVRGTLFEQCHGSLRNLMYLMLIMSNSTGIVSSSFVARHFGVSRMAAYRKLMLIRAHFAALLSNEQRGGPGSTVHIDETWCSRMRVSGTGARRGVIVFGIIDQFGATVQVVDSRRKAELVPIILNTVRRGSLIVTDQHASYAKLSEYGFDHVTLNHSRGQWSDQFGNSSAMIESYWTSLKYFLRFSNGSIHDRQLPLYIAEHVVKFNERRNNLCVFRRIISQFPDIDRTRLPPIIRLTRKPRAD